MFHSSVKHYNKLNGSLKSKIHSQHFKEVVRRCAIYIPLVIIGIIIFIRWNSPYEVRIVEPRQSLAPKRIILEPRHAFCGRNLDLLIFVHTRTGAFNKRNEIRTNYGRLAEKYKYGVIFPVGLPSEEAENVLLENESDVYGDLLQGDFIDSYKNITHKHLMVLRYAASPKCSHIPVVLKTDDDVVWNVRKLAKLRDEVDFQEKLDSLHEENPKIWCKVKTNESIQRMSTEKWAISRSEIPEETYPDYCPGMGLLYTQSSISRLLDVVESQRWLWIDDVFFTGYVRESADVSLVDLSHEVDVYWENGTNLQLFKNGDATFGYPESSSSMDELFHIVNDLA